MKRIVITEATTKVGAATVKHFLHKGWTVVGFGSNEKVAEETRAMSGTNGVDGQFYYLEGDISKSKETGIFYEFVIRKMGGVDAVFNNTEIGAKGELHLISEEKWDEVFSINLRSILLTAQTFIPYMIENGGGAIVNSASVSGLQGDYNMAAYCAAQGGVVNLTRAMALDYGKFNIRVNAICAGAENIPMYLSEGDEIWREYSNVNPLRKVGKPDECAKAVYFLASDEASHCSGVLLPITGGIEVQTGHPRNEGMA